MLTVSQKDLELCLLLKKKVRTFLHRLNIWQQASARTLKLLIVVDKVSTSDFHPNLKNSKPVLSVDKVDVGVQTFPGDIL